MPARPSPPATPISACSRMARLRTPSGCRPRASAKADAEMAAVTPASRGSVSSALVTRSAKTVRMSFTVLVMSGLLPDRGDHDGRAAGVGGGERVLQGVVVAAVDGDRGPALDLEAAGDAAGPAVARRRVVDDDRGQPVQPEPSGERDGLVVAALVELA